MKIAFVHDRLVYSWWAEKVFSEMIQEIISNKEQNYYFSEKIRKKFGIKNISEYKIFTTFYNSQIDLFKNFQIEPVISNKLLLKYYRHLMPLFPLFQKILSYKIRKFDPDLIIISSFAIAKNIDVNKPKILYLHSPMQYIRSHYEEYKNKFWFLTRQIYKISSFFLRKWDKKYTTFNYIIFNSNYTKETFTKFYDNPKFEGKIIRPKVEIPEFKEVDVFKKYNLNKEYYIYIWRLVRLVKHLDKIIEAFNKNWKQLVIVWDWPDKDYLKKIAKENIKFLWYIDQKTDDYRNLLKNAKALVNITKESFWIVNKQASLLWIPIICKNYWAIKDIPWKKIFVDDKILFDKS